MIDSLKSLSNETEVAVLLSGIGVGLIMKYAIFSQRVDADNIMRVSFIVCKGSLLKQLTEAEQEEKYERCSHIKDLLKELEEYKIRWFELKNEKA